MTIKKTKTGGITKHQAASNLADSAQSLVNAINHYESIKDNDDYCQDSFKEGIVECEKELAAAIKVMQGKFTK